MRALSVALVALSLTVTPVLAQGSAGSSEGEDCLITEAADAAVQRQMQLIDAAKVNPQDFFSGPNSCISENLLKSINLANFIPDLAGFLTGSITSMITDTLNQAKQQVCNALNDQLRSLVQQIGSANACFNSKMSFEMSDILGNFGGLGIGSGGSCGMGNFDLSKNKGNFGSLFGSGSGSSARNAVMPAQAPVIQAAPAVQAAPAASAQSPAPKGIVDDFGSVLFGR